MKRILLTGQRFGRLLVIQEIERYISRELYCIGLCRCGNVKRFRKQHLMNGKTTSCGCKKAEIRQIVKKLVFDNRRLELKHFGVQKELYKQDKSR